MLININQNQSIISSQITPHQNSRIQMRESSSDFLFGWKISLFSKMQFILNYQSSSVKTLIVDYKSLS